MRLDARRADQLRPVKLSSGYTRYAEGSVLISQGRTVVLCNATVDDRLPDPAAGGIGTLLAAQREALAGA